MASLPPQFSTAGRPWSSESNRESTSASYSADRPDASSTSLEDSETVFLNRLQTSDNTTDTSAHTDNSSRLIAQPTLAQSSLPVAPDFEPRKCWICYTDETEDSPLNSEWRSPCPCALTAHEACLLDWLADLENPKSRKRGQAAKMHCPQCKAEIVISRPRSYIVDLVRSLERLAGRLVLPGMVFTLAGTVWAGCCAHGVYTIYFVFGSEDAARIFEDGANGAWNPSLNLGLPLIPLVLIFSRTRYAEGLLPAIPVLFFATHNPNAGQDLDVSLWPPSAAMTFAALPYVKSLYCSIYEKVFGKLERKWLAEVQPRADEVATEGQGQPQQAQQPAEPQNHVDAQGAGPVAELDNQDVLMEFDFDIHVGMGDEEPRGIFGRAVEEEPAPQGIAGEQGQGQNGEMADQQQGNQALGQRQNNIIYETGNLADTVLGALLFPAISASMGGVLRMALPRSWTTPPPIEKGRAGLLQSRWGRSVIGGCLFVLLKDALVLYCRWKLAQTHRKRRVLNYDKVKKQVVGR